MSHFLEQGEGFFNHALGAGNDDTESTAAQPMQRVDVTGRVLDLQAGRDQHFTNFSADGDLTVNDENSAHRDLGEGPA
jgi:hypothetical protein